ncbi:DUF5689 domain-containing protein [Rufibacter immobilis]|uniref:DUF5689 domain-containing protein n=1 Tax=Rufibacter immobilis TaxID=1348778 RepID=UPI0035EFB9A4
MKNKYFIYIASVVGALTLSGCLEEIPNPAEGTLSPVVAIKYVRELYNGDDIVLQKEMLMDAYLISGIVISDAAGKNVSGNTLVLQNMNKGNMRGLTIALKEDVANQYKIGDSITVDVTGGTLTKVAGTLQITGIDAGDVRKVAPGAKVMVQPVTLGNLFTNFANYESTLVQVTSASVTPAATAGTPLAGEKTLDDGTGGNIQLAVSPTAAFASEKTPLTANFIGIPTYFNTDRNSSIGAAMQLRIRNEVDITDPVGAKYAAFPETFESPVATAKGNYNMTEIDNNIDLASGNWKLYQSILASTFGSDRFNPSGLQSIRVQQNLSENAYIQMNFDVPNGASMVTVSYGSYGSDASSTFRLEYSQDGGVTWTQIGPDISNAASVPKLATFPMNIQGPVRFRINKLGLGTTDNKDILNGRLSIDDFTIYESVE